MSTVCAGGGFAVDQIGPARGRTSFFVDGDDHAGPPAPEREGSLPSPPPPPPASSPSPSSSIGEASESSPSASAAAKKGDDEEEGEVQSKEKAQEESISLDSLEDSLPVKRGLSKFYSGKAKSFASLADAVATRDLAKPENPFNKRRRILTAAWSRRRASCNSLSVLPPLPAPSFQILREEDYEDGDGGDSDDQLERASKADLDRARSSRGQQAAPAALRSPRCFSFSDLQHAK